MKKRPRKYKCSNCEHFKKIANPELSGGKCKALLEVLQFTNTILPTHGLLVQDNFQCVLFEFKGEPECQNANQ